MGSAREAAFSALQKWRTNNAWSEAALNTAIERNGLDRRDAALASRLCYGTIQNLYYLDYYLNFYSKTPVNRLEPQVLDIMRLSAYQILFLTHIPVHAAVSEGVALCKRRAPRASGLVNAVLRRIAENAQSLPVVPGEGSAEYLSVRWSHPLWLCEQLVQEHGYVFSDSFLAANNAETPVCIQTNLLRTSSDALLENLRAQGFDASAHPIVPDALLVSGGNLTSTEAFRSGEFFVQDAAANLAVRCAQPSPGMTVLDACAAPGGKSFAAAVLMQGQGKICSCDLHENKLKRIREGSARLGFDLIETSACDARAQTGVYDVVLADVPCSGLGVIRKKPEIRFKDQQSLSALPGIQRSILEGLSRCVCPGGVLLYSTCTILPEENENVVAAFLSEHPEFALESTKWTPEGMRTFWPHLDGTDGFYIAKLRKHA